MHSDETIDVCAPFWAFPGEHGLLGGAAETHGGDFRKLDAGAAAFVGQTGSSNNNNNNNKNKEEEEESDAGLYHHRFDSMMDVDVGSGGSGGPAGEVEEHIADNVDGFLDDFLALAGGGDGDIAEEDLNWLEDMDPAAFLPPPPPPPGSPATAAPGHAAADHDGAAAAPVHEVEPPVPAVVIGSAEEEGGAAPTPVSAPVAAAAAAAAPGVAAVGVTTSAAGLLVRPDASGVDGGSGGRGGCPTVGASAVCGAPFHDRTGGGGGGGAGGGGSSSGGPGCAAEVSPKEQLRRQKVARYLEKKKRRRSTKACSYQSRQRVANARPRHKGRFLPLESEFVPVAELRRRQFALVKEMRDKVAALATAAAVSGDAAMPSPEFGQRVAV